ncbi:erythromycin esterase family protein [Saccharomonospora sp. NB11]|uniref:erythromycin esterase family protein n=1 Tax=Saccharomonospora sp. NB11 TaxID=1642298 RepID=UPI0027DC8DEF|nr:erythromycin esterase family protein [Saccharomonospora sp. NB11]
MGRRWRSRRCWRAPRWWGSPPLCARRGSLCSPPGCSSACLIEHAGFRALFIEGTEETGLTLDRYLYTGEGDLRALVRSSQSFLRAVDVEDVLRGLRSWNREHPDDPVSVVSVPNPVEADSLAGIEAALADTVLTWRAETGQRIVHWGGIAHLVAGETRRLSPPRPRRP